MKIISFAWTTPQLLRGEKTVTRRDWSDKYARQFKAGDLVQAYDKSPRTDGKRVAIIEIKSIDRGPLWVLKDRIYGPAEMAKEGFPGRDPLEFAKTFFSNSRRRDGTVWRIEFEVIELDTPDGEFVRSVAAT